MVRTSFLIFMTIILAALLLAQTSVAGDAGSFIELSSNLLINNGQN